MLVLVVYVVPVFAGVLQQFGTNASQQSLPGMTQITVNLSHAITGYWYAIILGFGGLIFLFRYWKRSESGRPQWDAARLKIPFKIGGIVQKIAIARWSRTFAALTSAGVPLIEALDITGRTAGNEVIARVMNDVIESVKRGGSISEPLKQSDVFPLMVSQMVAVGESTGELDWMLSKVADFYEERVAAAVKALTSVIEPVMIVVIGGMVGFVVIAMYLPLIKVYNNVQ
jgi:type IV pilus assembly protein PilC